MTTIQVCHYLLKILGTCTISFNQIFCYSYQCYYLLDNTNLTGEFKINFITKFYCYLFTSSSI